MSVLEIKSESDTVAPLRKIIQTVMFFDPVSVTQGKPTVTVEQVAWQQFVLLAGVRNWHIKGYFVTITALRFEDDPNKIEMAVLNTSKNDPLPSEELARSIAETCLDNIKYQRLDGDHSKGLFVFTGDPKKDFLRQGRCRQKNNPQTPR